MMNLTKRDPFTGDYNTMELPITEHEYNSWKSTGAFIQDCFPHLTADQREFMISGCMPASWQAMFGDEEWADDVPLPSDYDDDIPF